MNNRTKLILLALVIALVSFFLGTRFSSKQAPIVTSGASDSKVQVPPARAKQTLNREFSFAIKDDKGKEISQLKYVIQGAELNDQIIVKAQPYNAIAGKTFLILNLKLTNTYNQGIQINSRDYVRLSVNGSSEFVAPEIHNDPVQVQAISTKYTRLGFTIDEKYKTLDLRVGEIDGPKQTIRLLLK